MNVCSSSRRLLPPRKRYEGVRAIPEYSLSHFLVILRRCFLPRTRQSDYRALLLSLSHRNSSMVSAAPSVRKTGLGALLAPDWKTDPSQSAFYSGVMRNKSLRIVQPLEQLTSSRRIMIVRFWLSLPRCLTGRTRNTIAVVLSLLP